MRIPKHWPRCTAKKLNGERCVNHLWGPGDELCGIHRNRLKNQLLKRWKAARLAGAIDGIDGVPIVNIFTRTTLLGSGWRDQE